MKIEEQDFILESSNETSILFDLQLLKTIRPKSGPVREEFQIIGYGVPLERCLKHIIKHRIDQKYPDTMTLKQYLNEYKIILKELKELIS